MNAKGRPSSFFLLYGLLVTVVLNPIRASTLCESRCEGANHSLRRLKAFWHSISKRENGEDVSFTYFIKVLLDAAKRNEDLVLLQRDLGNMVLEYKDCMKACEHQHSKRTARRSNSGKICVPYLACY